MSESTRRLARKVRHPQALPKNPTYSTEAIFVAAEGIDSNLSHITIYGVDYHFIRKLESVTGLSTGDRLRCDWSESISLHIVGVIVGDHTVAEV